MYTPDVWKIIKLSGTDVGEPYYRVLAGWYGGYLNGDSWKINSGIDSVEVDGAFYIFKGSSGSLYKCHKDCERFSNMTASVFSSYARQNSDAITMFEVDVEEVLDKFGVVV